MAFVAFNSFQRMAATKPLKTYAAQVFIPPPILQYKFDTGDQVGLNLYNWATGQYDASLTATGLISTSGPTPSTGTGCLNLSAGTNYVTINTTMLATPLASSGFSTNGWYPLTTQGYSFTFWAYTTAGWTGSGFTWISGANDWYIAVKPGDRVSFGQSNYNGYPATTPADGSWAFYALVFPINSVTLNNKPILWQNGVSYLITPQIGVTGSLTPSGYYGNKFYIGYSGGASYIGSGIFKGYMDDFRMYNIALTDQQVSNIRNKIT